MYDPQTVAHEIKYPWRAHSRAYIKRRAAQGVSPNVLEWERKRRDSFITIWHVDPERDAHKHGTRGDDTCGWFHPPTTPENRARVRKLGEDEYSTIFGRQAAEAEGKDYAYICFEPSPYDAIYWAWRAIKREFGRARGPWKFGEGRVLTRAELDEIYMLASNPIDNLRVSVREVKDAKSCGRFFLTVYRCFVRHHRPWWRHPRWHFWHWKLQIHPWQQFKRWAFDRCADCGKGFSWGYSPWGYGDKRSFHTECGNASSHYLPEKMREEG